MNNKEEIKLVLDVDIHIETIKRVVAPFAIRFCCPFYLVGSFLTKGIDALDLDIIMVVTEDRWLRLFRTKEWNDRQYRFCKKQKLELEKFLLLDVDFKVQTFEQFEKFKDKPHLRLDNQFETKESNSV